MKIYSTQNVYDAALDRVRWLFDEFENLSVNFSGGKDSTVVLHLALQVAEERGRLPLPVMFLDQEAEWRATVDYVEQVMSDPRVDPYWVQCEFRISNAASSSDDWIWCWKEGDTWMRPKHPLAIRKRDYGTVTFAELFNRVFTEEIAHGGKGVKLAGVRAEESPARLKGLTTYPTYKGRTWGKVEDAKREQFAMYPIYDWSYTDVWKCIFDQNLPYNRVYDYQYQHGVPVAKMRVSSLTHDTALPVLFYLQEVEPDTWSALTARMQGINTVGHLRQDFLTVKDLPPMFASWAEYRDYLVEHLIEDPAKREKFSRMFKQSSARYVEEIQPELVKLHIKALLTDDYHGTKLTTFAASHGRFAINRGKLGGDLTERWNR